ncbi:MAG: transcriptional activator NhaR, partial [Lacipirellulaceae bacterium]
MDWLNYHHLLYFYTVAKHGNMTQAAEHLHLSQPTLSSQIKKLETSVGQKLFSRTGRTMVLTETGQTVFRYADEIFSIGKELSEVLKGKASKSRRRLIVGVTDVLPKLIVYELLKPAMSIEDEVQIQCFEGKLQDLLAELALHRFDLVLADSPLTPDANVRAYNHLLGECDATVFGTKELAQKYKKNFPKSLSDAPMLLPLQSTTLRRQLEQWFDTHEIMPDVVHEFEDSAVIKIFGQAGHGLFVAPSVIEKDVCQRYSVEIVGKLTEVKERFY